MIHIDSNINAMPRKIKCKLNINGNDITGVKRLTYSTSWSGDITIGQVIAACINVTIPTPSYAITNESVLHSMGIEENNSTEWVNIGQYTVDENSVRSKMGYTSFMAYDKLYKAINTYTANNNYSDTLQGLLDDVCAQIGITSITLDIGIRNIAIDKSSLNGFTLRDVLGFTAAMCGKNAYLRADNTIDLRWFTGTSYTANNYNANVPYIGENDCIVNRLICQAADGVLISGNGGQGIYFTCPVMTQSRLDDLQSILKDFTYRKADIDIPYGNFCIQAGDIITVTTVTGLTLSVPVMDNSWTYDGGLSSNVSAYGVSDYTGTANNAPKSASNNRIMSLIAEKQAKKREQQQYTSLQGEIQHAAELITGATGGYIKIEFGGNGKTAQLLVMDEPLIDNAKNVWVFNQNGLGHMGRSTTSVPFDWTDINLALTKKGTIVAERIAGTKISGVILETFYKASSGTQSHIMVENGSYTINKATVDSSGDIVGTPTTVGKLHFIDRAQMQGDRDTVSIQVQPGNAFTIGTLDQNNPAGLGNSEFYYYSDLNTAPSGAKTFIFYANHTQNDGVAIFGDVFFDRADQSLKALKSTVDGIYNDIHGSGGILDRLDDLERRVTALGG